ADRARAPAAKAATSAPFLVVDIVCHGPFGWTRQMPPPPQAGRRDGADRPDWTGCGPTYAGSSRALKPRAVVNHPPGRLSTTGQRVLTCGDTATWTTCGHVANGNRDARNRYPFATCFPGE